MLQRRHPGRHRTRSFTVQVPPEPRYCAIVRAKIDELADGSKIAKSDLSDFATAVGEALANAIEHSHSKESIEVSCSLDPWSLAATVVDHGQGFNAPHMLERGLPDLMAERGRGLPLMLRFCDVVDVKSSLGGGTAVRLGMLLRPNPRPKHNLLSSVAP